MNSSVKLKIYLIFSFVAVAVVPTALVVLLTGTWIDPAALGVLVFAVIAGVIAGIITVNSITRPIKELNNAALEYAKGNFDYKPNVSSKSIMGGLAASLNRTALHFKRIYEREKNMSSIKSEFIMVAAHKLRTPLSAIRWTFNVLLSEEAGKLNEMQLKALKEGNKVSEQVVNLVKDLLNVSEMEEGRFGYTLEPANIDELIEKIVEEEKVRAQEGGVRLLFTKSQQTLPQLQLDSGRMRTALFNIIDNAIRYSPNGGNVEIDLKKKDENTVQISVKDQGIGIPRQHMQKLFSKFSRAENAVRLYTEGSGLGLYIAKNIIQRHGGSIQVVSEENKGSVFYVYLPINPDKETIEAEQGFSELVEGL